MAGEIRLGTSSFTADGWSGSFYPKGMKSADYLAYYSSRFDTVEVDSTFYRCPTIEAGRNRALKTPPGFIFSLKIPRTITHEKVLVECDKEFEEFLGAADVLGEKLGPIVFQFPYFNKDIFNTPVQFLAVAGRMFCCTSRIESPVVILLDCTSRNKPPEVSYPERARREPKPGTSAALLLVEQHKNAEYFCAIAYHLCAQ